MTPPEADPPANPARPSSAASIAKARQSVLPVLDLMAGHVVRGIAGRRDQYRPITSLVCPNSDPLSVARSLRAHYGFQRLYVADLDAILHQRLHADELNQLCADGFELLLDAGVRSSDDVRRLLDADVHRVVLGLESLRSPLDLFRILEAKNNRQLVFSLDLQAGRPMTGAEWPSEPIAIVELVVNAGITSLILLDLSAVGMEAGLATTGLCQQCRGCYPHLELITGGGVRSVDDLYIAIDSGADQVLVASALHDGRLDSLWQGASESTQSVL